MSKRNESDKHKGTRHLKGQKSNKSKKSNLLSIVELSKKTNNKPSSTHRLKNKKEQDTYVQHDYHDYSMARCDDIPDNCHTSYHMNHKGGNDILFPEKLHKLLTDVQHLDQEICSWASHGRCFFINNREEFSKKYLTKVFNMHSYTSFQRQISRYCFKTITRFNSADKGAYYHELFLCGRPSLSRLIRGKRYKGNQFKPLSNPENEPDFYLFPPCYEIVKDLEVVFVSSQEDKYDLPTSQAISHESTSNRCSPQISTLNIMSAIPGTQNTFVPMRMSDTMGNYGLNRMTTMSAPHGLQPIAMVDAINTSTVTHHFYNLAAHVSPLALITEPAVLFPQFRPTLSHLDHVQPIGHFVFTEQTLKSALTSRTDTTGEKSNDDIISATKKIENGI